LQGIRPEHRMDLKNRKEITSPSFSYPVYPAAEGDPMPYPVN
jgi:hypothetical protein